MSYCGKQDLIDRFGEDELIQLTDRPDPETGTVTGAIVDAVLNQAIGDADAEINGWLAGRYQLPLATAPEVLRRIGCDIARYNLHGNSVPDPVRRRYEDAVKFLVQVGKGAVSLGINPAGQAGSDRALPEMQSSTGVFGRDHDD